VPEQLRPLLQSSKWGPRAPAATYDTGIGQIDPNLVRYLRGTANIPGPVKFNEGGIASLGSGPGQQMVPVDPSLRDRLEMFLSDTFGHTPVGRRRANMFMRAAEWMPGVDEGLLFSDAGEAVEQGKYITGGVLGGLGALSMAPFVPPGAGRSLEEIMKSLKKKVKKRPDDTPVIPDSGEGKRYDSNLPVSDHAQGRRTREADIRRQQQELDLRPEAKLARAKDQDFNVDRPLYHQTDTTFTEFKLQTPPKESMKGPGIYLSQSPNRRGRYGQIQMPLFARGKLAQDTDVIAAKAQIKEQMKAGILEQKFTFNEYWTDIHQILKDKGFTGIQTGDTTLIFDPKNLRRIDANFDPAKAGSADLLSGIGSFAATQGIA
jgi:hypothetical protein